MTQKLLSTCPYCGVGCGIQVSVDVAQRQLAVTGDPDHPANFGRLCSKGSALGETVGLAGRLLHPEINGHVADWSSALDLVAERFKAIIASDGPNAVAIYGSGQLLTEDYYVANKLMKGFIGSANMDTNSRLCMSSSVSGHRRAFGSDTVPGCYEDLEQTDLIVLIGSNAAWCHPVTFQRIRAAKERNPAMKVVIIDPRETASCEIADLHLAIASGRDAFLFNGLLQYLHTSGCLDHEFIQQHTEGFTAALDAAKAEQTIAAVAEACELPLKSVAQFYNWFAAHEKVMSLYSQGINQSASGTDKVNAIINCHLATGRIGKLGMGPFSLTGQPNAMGGREVGGLANQLAAHMDFSKPEDIERVARFWESPNIAQQPGLSAIELFDAIHAGKVKAVWIMGTNPVVSLPNADHVKAALLRCEFVVVSDCIAQTDTTALAHVLLPAQGWSEKDGTVTNSERRISRQRALLPPAGEAKADWWILTQVARRMGFADAFPYESPVEIFREHAALSAFENTGQRDFDLSAFTALSAAEYADFHPIQWPVNAANPKGTARLFADGHFFTSSKKAQFIALSPRLPVNSLSEAYPLVLNTGRLRDQWHTMTRTALAIKLNQHRPEPMVEIHPDDAERYQVQDKGLASIQSAWGNMLVRVMVTTTQKVGNVFVPMHWTAQYASRSRMGALVNPVYDPVSKQPESKHTPVYIETYQPAWQGFLLTREPLTMAENQGLKQLDYWVKINSESLYRYELASSNLPADCLNWAKQWLSSSLASDSHWQEYADAATGHFRLARIVDERVELVLFISCTDSLPDRAWLSHLFTQEKMSAAERKTLLLGLPPAGSPDVGAIICACFNVGAKTISAAITKQGLKTHHEVGLCLKAGTNCGSCIPEIKALL